ncbi:MAG: hypothetical protein JXO22_13480, partial [Phycisphaerae bacterium]|nr:hypothetical protein [Phycisphaerae bacterium]
KPAGDEPMTVLVTESGRHITGEPDTTKLTSEQKRFQSAVESADRKASTILREPYKIVRQIERGDRESASLVAKYRRDWKKLVGIARRAEMDKRGDQTRIQSMREDLIADLAETFRAVCRDAAEKTMVSPVVELMLIEDGAPDSLAQQRASWSAMTAQGTDDTRKAIEDFIKPPSEAEQPTDAIEAEKDPNDPNAQNATKDEKKPEKPAFKPVFSP